MFCHLFLVLLEPSSTTRADFADARELTFMSYKATIRVELCCIAVYVVDIVLLLYHQGVRTFVASRKNLV